MILWLVGAFVCLSVHALCICIKILCFFYSHHTFRLVFEVPALASFTLAFQHLQFFFHLFVRFNAAMLLRTKYSIWNSVLCRFASWNFTKEIFTVTVWMQCTRLFIRSLIWINFIFLNLNYFNAVIARQSDSC